jgi:glycosyltransferase involved in cell wall biosynthesis
LKDNLDAVLSQTYRPLQCVISDHSRDDAIETFIASVDKKDIEFVYVRYPDHYGNPSYNWNNGIAHATGSYIHPIAMDERLADESSVQRIVDFMQTTSAQWIGIACRVEPEGRIHIPSWNSDIIRTNSIGGTGSVVIRDTLKHVKFDTEFTWLLDVDWYARLEIAGGKPDFLPLPVGYVVRIHPLQLTSLLTMEEKTNEDRRIEIKYSR